MRVSCGPLLVMGMSHGDSSLRLPALQEVAAQSGPQHQAQAATDPNPEGVPMKHCRRCNTHKPVTQFYKSKANADGYDGRCKSCDAVQCAMRRKRKERIEVSLFSTLSGVGC